MKQNRASRTAEYMALFRALESLRPSNIRLFADPFAQSFLAPSLRRVVKLAQAPVLRRAVNWLIDRKWPGARASGIARTRFIDDAVAKALQDGIEQVVILGAGFDCRAYRIRGIERIRVYEVDHPATLAAKKKHLQQVLGTVPPHVTFVEIDFNQHRLADALATKKFDASRRTLFIWEGVTNYLTEEAVDSTLRYISGASVGSQLIFTYVHRAVLDNPAEFDGTHNLIHLLQREDEPWTFGLYPDAVPAYLKARGFELIEDIGSVEYRARYMNPNGLHMKGYEFYRIAVARIVGNSFDMQLT
jgi:methyltransferase (TIGR00027 family)